MRYSITEQKKAELDVLTAKVITVQHQVDLAQSIVASLTDKLATYQALLAIAQTAQTSAAANRTFIDQLIQSALDLKQGAGIVFNQIKAADSKTQQLAAGTKSVLDKLIYSADMLNKFANLVVRQKMINPLISDDLVNRVTIASTDANNAVALTLVALKATIAAQASNIESKAISELTNMQSDLLYDSLTGSAGDKAPSIQHLLHAAYTDAGNHYHEMDKAVAMVTRQLSDEQAKLDKYQVELRSLQSGLAAANAAALAS